MTRANARPLDPFYWLIMTRRLAAVCLACTLISCSGPSSDPSSTGQANQATQTDKSTAVAVTYVCGNDFDLQNLNPTSLNVKFAVIGTSEQGELLLPPRSSASVPSTTRLTTLSSGGLQVSYPGAVGAPVGN